MKLPALLVSSLFIPLIAFATPSGVGSSLQKGLVGHWPLTGESEKVGSEMYDSAASTFESGTANWLTWPNTTIANIGNALEITYVDNNLGAMTYFRNAANLNTDLVIGKRYRITFDAKTTGGTATAIGHVECNPLPNPSTPTLTTSMQRYSLDFEASKTTGHYFDFRGLSAGNVITVDNISVKELHTADTTPYDNHGTIYGATSTTGPHEETDGAISFDGVDDWIEVTDNDSFDFGTNNFSLGAWINGTDTTGFNNILYHHYSPGYSLLTNKTDGVPRFWLGNTVINGTINLIDGNWHHVFVVRNNADVTIYVDGNEDNSSSTFSGLNGTSSEPICIGRYCGESINYPLNGSISDVRIYNRALTADEITQLYNEGGKTTVTQKPSLETGLVGHWELDGESEAWTALDGDDWQNSTAYGRIADTNYFSQNGNTIEVINTGSSWPGAGKMYATSEKGKYKIHIKTNLLNGKFQPAFHLYKDGTRVTYTATQVPTTATFTGNHASGFNYGIKSALGIYEATDIIDLTNAPDFDAIHVALLSYDGTASPYFEFQNTDIFVKQLVTADSTPYDNHGKIDGAVLAAGPNEETNGAMSFDGSNDYINCGTNSILDNEEALSVSAWIKTSYDAPFPGEIGLVKKGTGGTAGWSSPGWSFRLRDDVPAFALRKKDDTGYWDLYSGTPIIDGEWHHIVGTFDTTSIRKYVDGTQTQMTSTGQPYLISNGNCNIGKITNFFNGSMSDIKIYNRVLTPEEITQLYEEKANVVGNKVPSLETGLVGHWPLSGGYTNTTVFADITPYDNHGTITGTTLTTGINGESGGATSFNGTSDYVDIPLNIYGYNEITYSTWIKIDGSPASSLYSTITGNYGRSGIYIDSNGKARARAWDTTDHYTISTTSVTDNQWHHIAATYDQNNTLTKIYVDGNHENQMSYYPNIINWPSSYIAENPRTTVDILLNGLMADTRLYNRALSADEIKRLYEVR